MKKVYGRWNKWTDVRQIIVYIFLIRNAVGPMVMRLERGWHHNRTCIGQSSRIPANYQYKNLQIALFVVLSGIQMLANNNL